MSSEKPRLKYAEFAAKNQRGTVAWLIERYIVEMNGLNGHPPIKMLVRGQKPMSVEELIRELQKMSPLLPVRLKVRGLTHYFEEFEGGGSSISEGGGGDLDDVRFEGNHVSLEGQ